uniref:Elongation factor G n=1 Tax=candidate division WOR-3 bacterium TaxID=2052148 RepID=A0A7C3YP52_UNCW3
MDLAKIRNIGFAAHIDAGKTTTTERVLYYTGKIYRMGEVDEGTATMDWMEQEKERGITITAATTTTFWKDHRINIIDTPGHVDFTIEVERCMKVLDGVIIVFCGVGGVEVQSETVWRQADKYLIPRLAFVNKLDRTGSSFYRVLKMMEEKFNQKPVPIQIPIGSEENFIGVCDIIEEKGYIWKEETLGKEYEVIPIPEELEKEVRRWKEEIISILSDDDEELLKKFISGEEIKPEEIKRALRKATQKIKVFPVLCGSALKYKGIQPLLDAVVEYLPSPLDLPPVKGINPKTKKEEKREPLPSSPLSGLIFKIMHDPHRGIMAYVRIYSGVLKTNSPFLLVPPMRMERANRLLLMHANRPEEVSSLSAGEIGVIIGLKEVKTGWTICAAEHPIAFEPMEFPEPVVFLAIEPKTKAEEAKLKNSLRYLSLEDPTFKMREDEETGQIIISGMGELHLDIIIERLARDYGVNLRCGKPQVAYRETITRESFGRGKFLRTIEDQTNYAEVELRLEPGHEGLNIVFETDKIPPFFHPAIEKGILASASSGILAGYPITNLLVAITGGVYDPKNSTDLAFNVASSLAFQDAFKKGSPSLLEPIMSIEIISPDEYTGSVISDLAARRGKVLTIEQLKGYKMLLGEIPLSETFGYATTIRSRTSGRGTYSIQFLRYDLIPEEERKRLFPHLG